MMVRWFHKYAFARVDMEEGQLDGPTSGVQEVLVPERVVDALPTMYCLRPARSASRSRPYLDREGLSTPR